MALATATISYNLADLTGVPYFKGTRVTATTNIPGNTIADTEGNLVRLGEGKGTINADGTGTIAVWTPGTGSNPASWQTYVHVLHRVIQGPSQTHTFGPFTVTADATSRTVSNKALTSNVATLTTSVAHGLAVGMSVTVAGVDSTFNGTYTIASVPSATTLTYAKTASNVTSVAATGTLTSPNVNLADLVAEMPVQPEYAADVLDRLDALEADSGTGDALAALDEQVNGYTDRGNVSGAVTIDPVGTQVLVATGPTTLTIGAGTNGESFTIMVRGGGDYITWPSTVGFDSGVPEGDIVTVTLVRVRGSWIAPAGSGGGEVVPPVTDPPTQPGVVTVDPNSTGYDLTWIASTVASGYEVQIDGGSWVDSGTDLAHAHTGLASGSSHSGAIRAYNDLGERSTTRAWGPTSTDTPTFHEQLLAFSPALYTRFSQGSIEDFGTVTGTWGYDGGTAPLLNGTALTTGATGSAVFTTTKTMKRTVAAELDNVQKFTIIYLAHPNGATDDPSNLLFLMGGPKFGFGDSETYLEMRTQKHLMVQTMERDSGGTITRQQWRDGVSFAITFPSSIPGATYDVTNVLINGTGASPNAGAKTFLLDRVVLIAGTILTQADAIALSTAAGTYGNGGTA